MPLDSKHSGASFSQTSTNSLYFQVAQVLTCRDLAILVVTDDRQTDRQTDYFTTAHARGVISKSVERKREKERERGKERERERENDIMYTYTNIIINLPSPFAFKKASVMFGPN